MPEHIKINDQLPRVQHVADGTLVDFGYLFAIFETTDLEVYLDDVLQESGYAVNGAGSSSGGSVTFDGPPTAGTLVTLRRRVPVRRTSDFQDGGEFRAKVINDDLDRLVAMVQQTADDVTLTVRRAPTDAASADITLPAPVAEGLVGWNADASALTSYAKSTFKGDKGDQGDPGTGDMTSTNNLSELADASAARTNLGLGGAAVLDVGTTAGTVAAGNHSHGSSADLDARYNVALLAFRLAVQNGLTIQNMVGGIVDEFEDETGIGSSSGCFYDIDQDLLSTVVGYGADLCSGGTPGVSSYDAGLPAYPFDNDVVSRVGWWNSSTTLPAYVWYDFGAGNAKTIQQVRIFADSIGNYGGCANFRVQGSNDGSSYTTVYSGTNTSAATWTAYQFANSTAYRYWRIAIDSSHYSGRWCINEIEMMEYFAGDDAEIISTAFTATSQPDTGYVIAFQEDVDTVAPNNDILGHVSRDGGTTWSQATLIDEGDYASGQRILAGTADLSGQPAGTSMKWKLETANGVQQKLHGVALQWS